MDRTNLIKKNLQEQIDFFEEKLKNKLTDWDRRYYIVIIISLENMIKKLEAQSE